MHQNQTMEDGDQLEEERMDEYDWPSRDCHGPILRSNSRVPEMEVGAKELEHYIEPEYPRLPHDTSADWQYTMRRTMQEIIPGLFLGPYAAATRAKLDDMKAAGLTHIVCVRQNLEKNLIRPNHPDHFKYLVVEIADTVTENIISHFKVVNPFLDECLNAGGKVLVHGNAGISRSAAIVIAFIMSKYGVTLKDSFSFVQSKRFCCNPNEGFMAQLLEYEPIYRAQHTVPLPLPGQSLPRTSMKRELELEDNDRALDGSSSAALMATRRFDSCTVQTLPSSESSVFSLSSTVDHPPSHIQSTDSPMSI